MPEPDLRAAKRALRQRLRAGRAARSEAERAALADGIVAQVLTLPDLAAARCVTAYVSVADEPPTRRLLEALRARGLRVLLPLLRPDLDLEWADYRGPDRLGDGPHGLVEPSGPRLPPGTVAQADLLLVPGLAVDGSGARLGQGGGCYDRALARVPAGRPVLALLFDDELLDVATDPVPVAGHDRRVDGVVTPHRTVRLPLRT